MRKIGLTVVLALACATLGGALPAQAQSHARSLSGIWQGYYGYTDGRESVKFQAKLRSAGASFSGGTIEADTFADPTALFLTANVSGATQADGSVHFVKTYDGTGGQTQAVQYDGAFETERLCIKGTWQLAGNSGPFEMCANAGVVS